MGSSGVSSWLLILAEVFPVEIIRYSRFFNPWDRFHSSDHLDSGPKLETWLLPLAAGRFPYLQLWQNGILVFGGIPFWIQLSHRGFGSAGPDFSDLT
jgi:hypothetical protein